MSFKNKNRRHMTPPHDQNVPAHVAGKTRTQTAESLTERPRGHYITAHFSIGRAPIRTVKFRSLEGHLTGHCIMFSPLEGHSLRLCSHCRP